MVRGPILFVVVAAFAASNAGAMEYKGLCEASAGAFIDNTHFAVASDDTNLLQIYQRGKPDPVGSADMRTFTSFDQSDIEAAARIGNRVYWMSSHSFSYTRGDQPSRKVFFATKIVVQNGKPTLVGDRKPVTSLRDPIVRAARIKAADVNIEALAATPAGGMLIGFRRPLDSKNMAIVLPFRNPKDVIDKRARPKFGHPVSIDLGGNGLRSMELIRRNPARYLIVAGPLSDGSEGFALYRWGGPGTKLQRLKNVDLAGLRPEAAMAVPGKNIVQLLSDDEDICNDDKPESPSNQRRFRSIDVKP